MRKRILSMLLVLVMVLGMFPVMALADSAAPWELGDTYVSADRDAVLPSVDAIYRWSGPAQEYGCGKEAHTHSDSCYSYKFAEGGCGGRTSLSHWWHSEDCYEHDSNGRRVTELTCTKQEHVHQASELRYVWTLAETGSELQYRNWWPVYWDFDSRSDVRTSDLVTVTANNSTVKYSGGEVLSRTALTDATANTGDVLSGGFQITVQPGYYVSRYRLVCGNHTGCGITGYNQGITTENTAGNYTATVNYQPDADDFDHWYNIGGLHNNPSSSRGVYQPLTKPDASATNIYHTSGSNTLYPFYLLIEVKRDNAAYDITYDWGTLADQLTADEPGQDEYNNLPRNTEHTVLTPGVGAAEAADLGYQFLGWEIVSDSYADGILVNPGRKVTITGADIELVAQWAPAVTWRYTGTVPAGATVLPETTHYAEDELVPVVQVAAPAGYAFDGWEEVTANKVNLTGSSFSMPGAPVVIEGSFREDLTQTKDIGYTVEYYFNGIHDPQYDEQVSEPVWVNAPDTLAFDTNLIKVFPNWTYTSSNPADLTQPIADNAVIHLYYNGVHESLELSKAVYDADGVKLDDEDMTASRPVKVGDVLTYQITVENKGNTELTDVVVEDSPNGAGQTITLIAPTSGVTHTTKADAGYELVDVFTIASIPVGESVVIEYTYTVVADDAGKNLINNAFWYDEDEGDTSVTEVPVTDQHTLTVEHYADGVLQPARTKTYTMDEGSDWAVEVGGSAASNTYNAPETITVSGVQYAFDDPATTDDLYGTLDADTTVKLYYAKDEIGTTDPDEPDDVPDKYQVTFLYTTTEGGALEDGALTKEVVNVYDAVAFAQGGVIPAARGIATASGSTAAQTNGNYRFAGQWTLARQGHVAFVTDRTDRTLGSYQLPPVGSETVTAQQAVGGSTYIFTAVFEDIPAPALTMDKLVGFEETDIVPVGTKVEYIIHIENTGNVPLTDVVINDFMSYDSGEMENYRDYIQELRVTGTESDNYILEQELASITIKELAVDQIVSVEYVYVVQEADAAKKIHNIADAITTYEGQDYEVQDEAVITIEELTADLSVTKELTSVNGSTRIPDDFKTKEDDELVWTITVVNEGNATGTIKLTDILKRSDGTTLQLALEPAGTDGVYSVPAKSGDTPGKIEITAKYTVLDDDAGLTLINTVFAEDDSKEEEVESDPIEVEEPDFPPIFNLIIPALNKQDHTAYIIGYEDDTVRPQNNITRAEVATIFFRLLTDESRAYFWNQTNTYTDVSSADWYNNAVSTLSGANIINGYPDGTFRPNAPITRAEFAAIAARFSEATFGSGNSFTDVPASHWAARYIDLAEYLGWVNGYPDGSFKPNRSITRAEAMTLINRVLERAVEKEHMLSGMVTWIDNTPGQWYYEAVQEATNSHTYDRLNKFVSGQGFKYEDWHRILDVPNWTELEKSWSGATIR